jgi:dihydrofolate reductase
MGKVVYSMHVSLSGYVEDPQGDIRFSAPEPAVLDEANDLERVPDGCRLVRSADAVAEVARLKAESDGPLSLGGPALAASLGGLVDEYRLFVLPVVVGGGKPYLAAGSTPPLTLVEQRRFPRGTVLLRYTRAG